MVDKAVLGHAIIDDRVGFISRAASRGIFLSLSLSLDRAYSFLLYSLFYSLWGTGERLDFLA